MAENSFKKAMNVQYALVSKAVDICKLMAYSNEIVSECVKSLNSENSEKNILGLKSLGINFTYRKLLLGHTKELAQLLKAIHDGYIAEEKILVTIPTYHKFHSPFFVLARLINQHSKENDGTSPNFLGKYSLFNEIENFIDNKSKINLNLPRSEEFWECLKDLRNIGPDLNMLIDNETYLLSILSANSAFEEAVHDLDVAKQTYTKAQLDFNMENFETLNNLFVAGQSYETAKAVYNRALDNFIACCKTYEEVVTK